MTDDAMRTTLRVTKALADTQRIRILMLLEPGELCVCQIVDVLGLAPSTVSKHLSILAAADVVMSRKKGRWVYYHLPGPGADTASQPVIDWLCRTLKSDAQIMADRDRLASVSAFDSETLCQQQQGRVQKRALPDTPKTTNRDVNTHAK